MDVTFVITHIMIFYHLMQFGLNLSKESYILQCKLYITVSQSPSRWKLENCEISVKEHLLPPVASAFGIYFNWKLEPPLWIYHAFFGMTSPGQCHETLIPAKFKVIDKAQVIPSSFNHCLQVFLSMGYHT